VDGRWAGGFVGQHQRGTRPEVLSATRRSIGLRRSSVCQEGRGIIFRRRFPRSATCRQATEPATEITAAVHMGRAGVGGGPFFTSPAYQDDRQGPRGGRPSTANDGGSRTSISPGKPPRSSFEVKSGQTGNAESTFCWAEEVYARAEGCDREKPSRR